MHGIRAIRGRRHRTSGDDHRLAGAGGFGMMTNIPAGFALGCLAWQEQCPLLSQEIIEKSNPNRRLSRSTSSPLAVVGSQTCIPSRPSSAGGVLISKKSAKRPISAPGCRKDSVDIDKFGEEEEVVVTPTSCTGTNRTSATSAGRRKSSLGIDYLADRQLRGRSNSILMTKDLMTVLGFDTAFDMRLNEEASKSCNVQRDHASRLREMHKEGRLAMTENRLAELDAEVLAGLCTLFFNVKGGVIRTVYVEALRVVCTDGAGLLQLAKRAPGKGYKMAVGLPGGKRHANQNPNLFIEQLLNTKLQWLPSEQLQYGTVEKMSFTEESVDFKIPTVYHKTVHRALLINQSAQLVRTGGVMRIQVNVPPDSASLNELPPAFRSSLSEVPVFAILNYNMTEVEVYGWLPSSVFDSYDSPENKPLLRKWSSCFKDEIESIVQNHALIAQRGQRRKVLPTLD